jgi:threonine/homoserine/homoserine lactone efflux protein
MSDLLAQIVPLALAAAISPVLVLLQLNTLTSERPLARGSALTAGAAVVLIIGSTLGVALGGTGFSDRETLQAIISLGFGVLLMLLGLRALLKPPKPKEPDEHPKPPSPRRSFVAGMGGMASNVTTFALYIPALALIGASDLPLGQRGLAALVILLLTLSIVWVPLAAAAFVPGASTNYLPRFGAWMSRNDRWIQMALGFGFGIFLAFKGIRGL